jgi:TolA-binding protein
MECGGSGLRPSGGCPEVRTGNLGLGIAKQGLGCFKIKQRRAWAFGNSGPDAFFRQILREVFESFQENSEEKGMKSQTYLFVIFCLLLTTGLIEANHLFHDYFSPMKAQQEHIVRLEAQVERQKLQVAMLKNQIADETQQVAWAVPALENMKPGSKNYALRNIASVSQAATESLDLSKPLLEQAKAEFRRGEYDQSARTFQELMKKYPTSPVLVESLFFQAESYFMNGKYQECLDVVDHMITQFPDHELTGYILLRQGQILEARHRSEEAEEVFRLVMKKFAYNHELSKQAKKMLETSVE